MEDLKVELEQLAQLLQNIRVAVEPLARDGRLRQWQKVNFDKHGDLLAECGLKPDLKKSRELVRATIETVLRELAKLENEYGDLAIDIRRRAIPAASALAQLQTIKNQANLLAPELLLLQEHCRLLLAADTQVRRLPTLAGLLPGAKRSTPKNVPSLEQGLCFFLFATQETTDPQPTSLGGIFARAAELERQLRAIKFTELPPMAVTLLEGIRQVGVRAADRLKSYVDDLQRHPPSEIRALQDFRQQLDQLRRREIGAIIDQLPQLSVRYGNLLLDLSLRARALRQNELMPALLGKLQLLHEILDQALPAELRRQLTADNSSLNPEWLAAEQAADFFTGLRGVMLTFKLLFQTLSGNKGVNAVELQRLTVGALTTLPYHGGGNEPERTKITLALSEMLEEYDRPFPYELLLAHLRKTVSIHGGRLERAILGYSIRERGNGANEPDQKAAGPDTTLARLTDKLETWSERFEVV